MDKYYLTNERLEELKQELKVLKTEKRMDVAERLKRSKEYGDLSENAEYAEAREEQNTVETRIFELEELLRKAVIIKKAEGSDRVQVGSKATVKKGGCPPDSPGQISQYLIVGSNEAKPEEGKISNESPIGKALLGKRVGDCVTVTTPAGQIDYQITKIE